MNRQEALAVDDVLYLNARRIGVISRIVPDAQTRRHAESIAPHIGVWTRLTGTLWALGTPAGPVVYVIAAEQHTTRRD